MGTSAKGLKFIFPKEVKGWLTYGQGKLLYDLVQKNSESGLAVELGSYHGRSTICLAQGSIKAEGGSIYAVDTFRGDSWMGFWPDFYNQFQKNIHRYGLEKRIVVIQNSTVKAAKSWCQPIRFLFIDAGHNYEEVKNDYLAWGKFVIPGGIIAFHDAKWFSVYKFVGELIKTGKIKDWRLLRETRGVGLCWAVKVGEIEKISFWKRKLSFWKYRIIYLPGFWSRFRFGINFRGLKNPNDFWFKFFGFLANFQKRLFLEKK